MTLPSHLPVIGFFSNSNNAKSHKLATHLQTLGFKFHTSVLQQALILLIQPSHCTGTTYRHGSGGASMQYSAHALAERGKFKSQHKQLSIPGSPDFQCSMLKDWEEHAKCKV